jgi:hypothetical protein
VRDYIRDFAGFRSSGAGVFPLQLRCCAGRRAAPSAFEFSFQHGETVLVARVVRVRSLRLAHIVYGGRVFVETRIAVADVVVGFGFE